MRNVLVVLAWCYLGLGLSSCKYSQSEYDSGVDQGYDNGFDDGEETGFDNGYDVGHTEGFSQGYAKGLLDAGNLDYNDGYNTGLAEGDAAGYSRGYAQGESSGYNTGYGEGYTDGDSDGYTDGYNVGLQDGYDEGYDAGFDEGVIVSYDEGYNDGEFDGYEIGYEDGYDDGDADGYDDGLTVGYEVGYDDGYDVGHVDGYGIGYDDGWFDAGGNSTKSKAQELTAGLMSDLIDFGKMKSPKEVLNSDSAQRALLSASSGMTVDTRKRNAILSSYVINEMKGQLVGKFGINEKRSLKIAMLAHQMMKADKAGELDMKTVDVFAKQALGASITSMQDAFKTSITGDSSKMDKIIKDAATLNEVSSEHAQKIMTKLMM